MHPPGVELVTSRSQVERPTTTLPSHRPTLLCLHYADTDQPELGYSSHTLDSTVCRCQGCCPWQWSLLVLKDKIVILGPGVGLEAQVLVSIPGRHTDAAAAAVATANTTIMTQRLLLTTVSLIRSITAVVIVVTPPSTCDALAVVTAEL